MVVEFSVFKAVLEFKTEPMKCKTAFCKWFFNFWIKNTINCSCTHLAIGICWICRSSSRLVVDELTSDIENISLEVLWICSDQWPETKINNKVFTLFNEFCSVFHENALLKVSCAFNEEIGIIFGCKQKMSKAIIFICFLTKNYCFFNI